VKGGWSYTVGERGFTVTVYEREPGGVLYARAWDSRARGGKGNWKRQSLKHRDKKRAQKYAREQSQKLENGGTDALTERAVTLAQVFAAYQQHRSPRKSRTEQQADGRRAELFARFLGASSDPHTVSMAKWQAFVDARTAGVIDSRGNVVAQAARKPVRSRSTEADCVWLLLVFNWAIKWRLNDGRYLMRENPVRGYEMPREKNPRRPVASQDRFERVRAVSDDVLMELRWSGTRTKTRSYLSELLDIVNGTGRRIRAICELRYDDIRLNDGRFGTIRWPAETDKTGHETVVPISPPVRNAIERVLRDRPGIGRAPLFPSPRFPEQPISRHLADAWLRRAEQLSGLAPLTGSLWHAYRRKWATERKGMPDVDVAAAGGWKSLEALKTCYQQADADTMLSVVMGGGELREAQ
jgi:integrase